jgi:hypothetical protein
LYTKEKSEHDVAQEIRGMVYDLPKKNG